MPWWWPFGSVPEIEPLDLQARLDAGHEFQLLDVRTRREYTSGHVAGAVLVPITRLRDVFRELELDPTVPVVAIGKTTHRSVPAVRILRREGFDAIQLAGGMDRWRRQGHPEVAAGQRR